MELLINICKLNYIYFIFMNLKTLKYSIFVVCYFGSLYYVIKKFSRIFIFTILSTPCRWLFNIFILPAPVINKETANISFIKFRSILYFFFVGFSLVKIFEPGEKIGLAFRHQHSLGLLPCGWFSLDRVASGGTYSYMSGFATIAV